MKSYKTTDEYIKQFPKNAREKLYEIRETIIGVARRGEECICYGIPTFKLNGENLIHFGGFKNHVSIFPGAEAVEVFKDSLKTFVTTKGTIQFPLDKPLPVNLIIKITRFRLNQVTEKNK